MRLILFSLFLCISFASYTQQINVYKTFGGVRFERDSLILSTKQVHYILQEEPEAFKQFKTARVNASVGSVLGFAGGLLIIIPVGSAIIGGTPEWGLALGGAALIVSSIPFNRAFHRHAIGALNTYNQKHPTHTSIKAELFWGGNGAGVRLRF